ncbi:UDP-N-acetylmuramoyl-tripeptide--D-alanyl-D-alanine ligase [Brevibacillus porteri]
MIYTILNLRMPTYKSMYNKNFLGNTRAHTKRIRDEHKAAVLEYGIYRSGHLRQHCKIIQPSMGVITNIGTAHIGNFGGDARQLALAKTELIRHMKPTGTIFLNGDCPYSRQFIQQPYLGAFSGKVVTFGKEQESDYKAGRTKIEGNGFRFECSLRGEKESFFVPIPGEHNLYNALAAVAVAHTMGIPVDDIRRGLSLFRGQPKRLTSYRLANNIQVLDDTYSSNPDAAKAAIDVLSQVGHTTKIAVLASMLEMGKYDVKGHEDVGKYLSQKNVDYLYTLGRSARNIARAAILSGFPANRVRHCLSKAGLHRRLAKQLKPNTAFLVKGSNRLKMGETVQFLCRVTANQSNRKG